MAFDSHPWYRKLRATLHRIGVVLSTVLLCTAGCGRKPGPDWSATKQMVRDRFPGAAQLSTEELAGWLASDRPKPLLLDARSAEEFAVSHLPDAELASDEEQALDELRGKSKDQPIVVYCSVGYRSSALVEKLKARGFTNTFNLEGSIFAWANEGRPVYRDGERVNKVHPSIASGACF